MLQDSESGQVRFKFHLPYSNFHLPLKNRMCWYVKAYFLTSLDARPQNLHTFSQVNLKYIQLTCPVRPAHYSFHLPFNYNLLILLALGNGASTNVEPCAWNWHAGCPKGWPGPKNELECSKTQVHIKFSGRINIVDKILRRIHDLKQYFASACAGTCQAHIQCTYRRSDAPKHGVTPGDLAKHILILRKSGWYWGVLEIARPHNFWAINYLTQTLRSEAPATESLSFQVLVPPLLIYESLGVQMTPRRPAASYTRKSLFHVIEKLLTGTLPGRK